MNGATIFLLLGCGVIVITANSPVSLKFKGARRSQNSNSNINTNTNTNIVYDSPKSTEDKETGESNPTVEDVRRVLDPETDPDILEMSVAAAQAAMAISKALANEMSESTALAVAEAIAKLFGSQEERNARRSYNVNTNTNTNVMGFGPSRVRDDYRDSLYENSPVYTPSPVLRSSAIEREDALMLDEMNFLQPRQRQIFGNTRLTRGPPANIKVLNDRMIHTDSLPSSRISADIDRRSSAYRRSVSRKANPNMNNYRRSSSSNSNSNSNSNTSSRRSSVNSNSNNNTNNIGRRS